MGKHKTIGVVGGVGPEAGADLFLKILRSTRASSDRDHLDVIMFSLPASIPDRTEYLTSGVRLNPAVPISKIIKKLYSCGVRVAGIPCNTAHSPKIFKRIATSVKRRCHGLTLVSMIDTVRADLHLRYRKETRVGILATLGTIGAGVYQQAVKDAGCVPVLPPKAVQKRVHACIYDRKYGIKSTGTPVSKKARQGVLNAISLFKKKGASVVMLGCTELPFVFSDGRMKLPGIDLLDPTALLARKLVQTAAPGKLLQLTNKANS